MPGIIKIEQPYSRCWQQFPVILQYRERSITIVAWWHRVAEGWNSGYTVPQVLLSFLIAIYGTFCVAAAVEDIPILTYHTHAPFIVTESEGLTYDFAEYLNSKAAGKYNFQVVPMSRPRLNKLIEKPDVFIVPWVNPVWFKDKSESRYLWSDRPVMEDGNAIISRSDRKLVYDGPASIGGLVFGGIHGHVYSGIDDFIDDSEVTRRVDTDNHFANFEKLRKKRIDVTLTPESAARFLIKQHELSDELYISPKPHTRYARRIMVLNNREDILSFINGVLAGSSSDSEWAALFDRYQ